MEEINKSKEKKIWTPPTFRILSIKETYGGATIATGENDYADPDLSGGLGG